jgi:hypothetical protein
MSIQEKLNTIREQISEVFTSGFEKGFERGSDTGYEGGYYAGVQSEYNKFWDSYQQNGNRNYYIRGFTGYGFDVNNFYPKYDIILGTDSAEQMFYAWTDADRHGDFDLSQRLEECGVVLDTSKAKYLMNCFAYGKFTRIPVVDITGCQPNYAWGSAQLFNCCYFLQTIDGLIINENNIPSSWFGSCGELRNLTLEGTLAQDGFDVSSCPKLTKPSILSILKVLSLNITETKTITFSIKHQSIIETDADCKPYWEAAKAAGWSFVYA